MDFWRSVNGEVTVQIVSANVSGVLTALNQAGIRVSDAKIVDELTVRITIRRQDYKQTEKTVLRKGASIKLEKRKGIFYTAAGLLRRPVLLMGLVIMIALAAYLPSRIFFVRVEGNVNVPTRLILEEAAQCGITFGASRREVRSEKMKNALLEVMPQLQWAGVNTSGCVATISVRERETVAQPEKTGGVSSIVAVRDGVILSYTATSGNALCKVGQAVTAGQVLISGYTDCGISIRATRAVGEIYARTEREISMVTPADYEFRDAITRQETKYSLIIGKKRINFYKGSGILPADCDRMYEEKCLTLPGGFQLPIAIVTEVWTYYDCSSGELSEEEAASLLRDSADRYLQLQMVAGQILSKDETVVYEDGLYLLTGKYACEEMIGREQKEEIIAPNGKYN